jgi:hypothetical protein
MRRAAWFAVVLKVPHPRCNRARRDILVQRHRVAFHDARRLVALQIPDHAAPLGSRTRETAVATSGASHPLSAASAPVFLRR